MSRFLLFSILLLSGAGCASEAPIGADGGLPAPDAPPTTDAAPDVPSGSCGLDAESSYERVDLPADDVTGPVGLGEDFVLLFSNAGLLVAPSIAGPYAPTTEVFDPADDRPDGRRGVRDMVRAGDEVIVLVGHHGLFRTRDGVTFESARAGLAPITDPGAPDYELVSAMGQVFLYDRFGVFGISTWRDARWVPVVEPMPFGLPESLAIASGQLFGVGASQLQRLEGDHFVTIPLDVPLGVRSIEGGGDLLVVLFDTYGEDVQRMALSRDGGRSFTTLTHPLAPSWETEGHADVTPSGELLWFRPTGVERLDRATETFVPMDDGNAEWAVETRGVQRTCIYAPERMVCSAANGLYELTGDRLSRVFGGLPSLVTGIARREGALVVAGRHALLLSTDRGHTFEPMPLPPISPASGADTFAEITDVAFFDGTLFVGTTILGLFATPDLGRTWRHVDVVDAFYATHRGFVRFDVLALEVHRTRLYLSYGSGSEGAEVLGGFDGAFANTSGGVFSTTDGVTFEALDAGIPRPYLNTPHMVGIETFAIGPSGTLVSGMLELSNHPPSGRWWYLERDERAEGWGEPVEGLSGPDFAPRRGFRSMVATETGTLAAVWPTRGYERRFGTGFTRNPDYDGVTRFARASSVLSATDALPGLRLSTDEARTWTRREGAGDPDPAWMLARDGRDLWLGTAHGARVMRDAMGCDDTVE